MQKTWFSKVLLTLKCTWLCIKYPFLYPRNRFTGLHYNNWKIINWHKYLYNKYHVFQEAKYGSDCRPYYHKFINNYESFWINWWALPLTKIIDWVHNNPLQWIHCLTDYTELDALPETWKNDFGLEWAKDLNQYLKEHNIKHYRISQLKEKWGEFDWLYPPDFEGALEIERKYIERSKSICICCGKPATHITSPYTWQLYYCKDCAPNHAEPLTKN